ncbi:MAG: PAS domain-containing sensor histidine kinase [Thermoflexales bacterium]
MSLSVEAFGLTSLLDVLVDAVVAFDEDQRIIYFNYGAEQLFGYQASEVIGKLIDHLIPPRFVNVHREHFRNFLRSPELSRSMNKRSAIYGLAKDGREFPAEAAISKVRVGERFISLVVMRDISERKKEEMERWREVERNAIEAERNRIARDLHDAVTQTLFSASLIADVLPRIWERDPVEGKRRLEELRQLSRGALAEMRTLLLELRPSALLDANLADLLRQLAASVMSRAQAEVEVKVEGPASVLPNDVKVALYRIAQEALNNVARHSNADKATVELRVQPSDHQRWHIAMCIADNGRGFDVAQPKPTHLGLNIMRERAVAIGASLHIQSQIGKGTTVNVELQT